MVKKQEGAKKPPAFRSKQMLVKSLPLHIFSSNQIQHCLDKQGVNYSVSDHFSYFYVVKYWIL